VLGNEDHGGLQDCGLRGRLHWLASVLLCVFTGFVSFQLFSFVTTGDSADRDKVLHVKEGLHLVASIVRELRSSSIHSSSSASYAFSRDSLAS
jgi:hypothetical protein